MASIKVGNRKQLFIDRTFITEDRGLSLHMNPPRKMGPVLQPERPGEGTQCGGYLSVVADGGGFKMWYNNYDEESGSGWLGYATSSDGVHWERPELNLVEVDGSSANNIVLNQAPEGGVYLDPVAPPESRFKLLAHRSVLNTSDYDGMFLLTSPDGLHWVNEYPVIPGVSDTQSQLFWDVGRNKYVAYLRGYPPKPPCERSMVRCEIPKEDILKPWPHTPAAEPKVIASMLRISGESLPIVIARDDGDPVDCDVYTPGVHRYGWAEDVYLAFPSFFFHTDPTETIPMAGILETQLAVSRDGIHWQRPDRRPYVPLGMVGQPDSQGIYVGTGMLRRGNEIYMYYGGKASPHAVKHVEDSAVMLVAQRLDGFMSLNATPAGGEFTTPPLTFSGHTLQLNVETSILGEVSVEVLDAEGHVVPGYAAQDCDALVTNDVARVVTWKERADLSGLQGAPIRLRFRMRNAKLYAFQFG